MSGKSGKRLRTGGSNCLASLTIEPPWTIDKLRALPKEAQVTRHICIGGWSQIGRWSGVPLHVFLQRVGADLKARYVLYQPAKSLTYGGFPPPATCDSIPAPIRGRRAWAER